MSETYSVCLEKESLVFSAAHFITYGGNICERLHGHNYRVRAQIWGPLDENHYVLDFIALRDTLQELTNSWDHHVLLPTEHPLIHVTNDQKEVTARFEDRRWMFPREDCVLLPISNTTAELLARLLGERLLDELERKTGVRPSGVRMEVDENFGQWATCEIASNPR